MAKVSEKSYLSAPHSRSVIQEYGRDVFRKPKKYDKILADAFPKTSGVVYCTMSDGALDRDAVIRIWRKACLPDIVTSKEANIYQVPHVSRPHLPPEEIPVAREQNWSRLNLINHFFGWFTQLYAPNGRKNSKNVIRLFENFGLAPSDQRVQSFLKLWAEQFSDFNVRYLIDWSLDAFLWLGHSRCDEGTCFGDGEVNSHHAPALCAGFPSFVLWLAHEGKEMPRHANGRCWGIVNPSNPEHVYISNFYYYKLAEIPNPFVRAIEDARQKGIMKFAHMEYFGPWVYYNGNALVILPYEEKLKAETKKFQVYPHKCVLCGSTYGLICSNCWDEEQNQAGEGYDYYCVGCNAGLYDGDWIGWYSDEPYCESCFYETAFFCENCDEAAHLDDRRTVFRLLLDDRRREAYWCGFCADDNALGCVKCGLEWKRASMITDEDLEVLCPECHEEKTQEVNASAS